MSPNRIKRNIILPTALVLGLLLFLLAGGVHFTNYLKSQIFVERTTQLEELTTQVRANLDNALSSSWSDLATAVNALEARSFDSADDVAGYVGTLEQLMEMEACGSMLMLLDSQGNYYDAQGRHGIWPDIDLLSSGGDRHTFISDSQSYSGSFWAFVQKLEKPIQAGDGQSFTYAVLLKDVHTLTQYYESEAYGSRNETYILKSNGTRMRDDITQSNSIQAYNVLNVLEEMEGQQHGNLRAVLAEKNTVSSNFQMNGQEYYYCITSLAEYDTLLLFLIPADFVAAGTVGMVGMVIRTLLFLAVGMAVLMILAVLSILRQHSSAQLYRQEQASLRRQEELNEQLEEYNAILARSKESVEQALQMAEEANRAKSSFLSNMSHDIRTPMNAIVGFAALLDRDAENPDKVREYTKKITASGQHLLGLINDILDISKIEAGKTALNLSDENMEELIEGIDSIIRPQMKAKGHRFEVYNKGLCHERVVMDKLRLNQILLNLLSNAVKYTPEGGHITLTIAELPQRTHKLARFRFVVEDNGYGMSEDYVERIFHAFTREEDSVTNKIQGTGLGMAITKNLLDLMGGIITVESEKGRGSKFTVDLDLHVSEQAIDHDFWQKNGITRLLVVDDEEVCRQSVQMTMEGTGVQVDCALDGRTAVDMVRRSEEEGRLYHVVLLDWKMPGMDGLETARRIRRTVRKDAPLLTLTSYDWMDIEEEARDAGIDAFMPKPFFLTNFRQKIDHLLNAAPVQPDAESEDEEQSVLRGLHILVAEDNEINAEILYELLDMAGATCEICENGQHVAETFAKSAPGQYQLILMDVQMPVMNGYEATRAIRALEHSLAKTIPIIAMTANAFSEDIRDALESGMDAHVAKPVDIAVLERTVKTVLEAGQLHPTAT